MAFLFYRVITFKVIIYLCKELVMVSFEKSQNQLVCMFNINEEIAVLNDPDDLPPKSKENCDSHSDWSKSVGVHNMAGLKIMGSESFRVVSNESPITELK